MRRTVLWILPTLLLPASCGKETKPLSPSDRNFAPEILSVSVREPHVLAAQEVTVSCTARDRDQDFLGFSWTASAGSFPRGSVLATVAWRSPSVREPQTLTVVVTDFRDTVTTDLAVPIVTVTPPEELDFVNGANLIDLSWSASVDEEVESWSGYEVYAAERDLAGLPADSVAAYRIVTSPLPRRQMRVSPVVAGVRMHFQVRGRRDYEGIVEISEDGPTIETAARLDGLGAEALFEIRSRRGAWGIHLPGGTLTALDPAQMDQVDLYLGTDDPEDAGGALRLKSPSRLAYLDPAWAGRVTVFKSIGEDWGLSIPPESGYAEELPVVVGQVYALLTADGHYGKLRVADVFGAPPERRIEFQWAWQPLPGYPRF